MLPDGTEPEANEPTVADLKILEDALIKQKRIAEAAYLTDGFGPEKPLTMKRLRDAAENDPLLKAHRQLFRGQALQGRFKRLEDGTFSADLRRLPPPLFLPLLKNEVVSVSVLYLDDRGFTDLAIFQGMELREISLAGCTTLSDLAPLTGMPLRVVSLRGTAVSDITPLTKLPLVELDLDGCTKLTDLKPLADCRTLEKLLLPRGAKNIEFLRGHPTLKFISARGLSEPVKDFWADYDKRRGDKGKPLPPAEKNNPPAPPSPPAAPAGGEPKK